MSLISNLEHCEGDPLSVLQILKRQKMQSNLTILQSFWYQLFVLTWSRTILCLYVPFLFLLQPSVEGERKRPSNTTWALNLMPLPLGVTDGAEV